MSHNTRNCPKNAKDPVPALVMDVYYQMVSGARHRGGRLLSFVVADHGDWVAILGSDESGTAGRLIRNFETCHCDATEEQKP